MNPYGKLSDLRKLYEKGINVVNHLRDNAGVMEQEAIMISYDLQAGSYSESYNSDETRLMESRRGLAEAIRHNDISGSVLEAGIGEATGFVSLFKILGDDGKRFTRRYGFDISWSRIWYARHFSREHNHSDLNLFVGDLLSIPIQDNSFDLVYTTAAVEPNGKNIKPILQELYRVTKKWLILIEPAFEFSSSEQRERMTSLGYARGLPEAAKELDCNVVRWEPYSVPGNPNHMRGIMIILKEQTGRDILTPPGFASPISGKAIQPTNEGFYCPESGLAYPLIRGIPCLCPGNAIVAIKFNALP
jgi:ubiquinone/menaquinone biosynthesis C-methylase UbiE